MGVDELSTPWPRTACGWPMKRAAAAIDLSQFKLEGASLRGINSLQGQDGRCEPGQSRSERRQAGRCRSVSARTFSGSKLTDANCKDANLRGTQLKGATPSPRRCICRRRSAQRARCWSTVAPAAVRDKSEMTQPALCTGANLESRKAQRCRSSAMPISSGAQPAQCRADRRSYP